MEAIGVENMLLHTMALVDRVRKELPESSYRCITPEGARSPILVFIPADYEGTQARLKQANVQATMTGNRLRISPNIYNNPGRCRQAARRPGVKGAAMNFNRRSFLAGGVAASVASQLGCGQESDPAPVLGDLDSARRDFPRSESGVYMNHASQHPLSVQSARAIERYAGYLANECSRAGWYEVCRTKRRPLAAHTSAKSRSCSPG